MASKPIDTDLERAPRVEYGPSTRIERVEMVQAVAVALADGQMPAPEAAMFVAGGLLAWLRRGGDLGRDYWRVTLPGSHETVQVLAACLQQGSSARKDAEEKARHSGQRRRVIRFGNHE